MVCIMLRIYGWRQREFRGFGLTNSRDKDVQDMNDRIISRPGSFIYCAGTGAARDMIGVSKEVIQLSRRERVLQNSRLDKRREDALKGNVPHITHNNHPAYAHQKCHQEIDGIIIQQTKPTLDVSACLIIPFLVMRARTNRHLVLRHK